MAIDGQLGRPARHGHASAKASRAGMARPTHRTVPCQPTGGIHGPCTAQYNLGRAGPARRHDGLSCFSKKKSIFRPSTVWAVFKWLENKSILYSFFLWALPYTVIKVYLYPYIFYILSGCAGPAHSAEGVAQTRPNTACLSGQAGTGTTPVGPCCAWAGPK